MGVLGYTLLNFFDIIKYIIEGYGMKINLVNQNQTNFNGLYIHENSKNKLSDEQKEIFKTTETTFNKPYSKDKNGRSYLEYIEKNAGKDYYLEKGQYKENSLDLYESFDFNTQKKYYYLATLTKEQPLNEDALIYECDNAKQVTRDEKLIKLSYLAVSLLALLVTGTQILQKKSINKPGEEKVTVMVKDSLNKISKDSLDVMRYFIKK